MNKPLLALCLALLSACATSSPEEAAGTPMDQLAERYVKTLLFIGQYDSDFIDAYYGPEEWRPTPAASPTGPLPADSLLAVLRNLQQELARHTVGSPDPQVQRRVEMLQNSYWPFVPR
ncbi:hypothetical protein [Cesiribacter andamanensis]|uniref:Uncharacterized protein n=1 Tax=Cesiribacter andamanensis AMV16 TaxID=1279009 RepID=M7NJA9_9BACT|nr:hypothetical protein [Cesiribacter andamanensis]EMR01860.1 hypothetical protein ADICEAN_03019 [Cesiribacter andamanensis AMV16]